MTILVRSPEQFLESFEHWQGETSDPQFSDGIPIIRAWLALRDARAATQTEIDALLARFAAVDDPGSHLHDLWCHVAEWARQQGYTVPTQSPWLKP